MTSALLFLSSLLHARQQRDLVFTRPKGLFARTMGVVFLVLGGFFADFGRACGFVIHDLSFRFARQIAWGPH